ncbi:MAG: beta galactosidase jelly roll domain-containing protein [Ignavibacteriales bacterium]|nr:beta galactosidase jelly roll domain-containing protein [Ignavibacteriales bacterium]
MNITQGLFGEVNNNIKDDTLLLLKWQLKSTVLEKTSGEEISQGHYKATQWYPVEVPTTVLNGLVKNGVYPNPRLDMNNYLIPDISDEFNAEHDLAKYSYLSNHVNPWKNPYWFRTEFKIPDNYKGKHVWLNFDGINYRAEVWLNGKMIADSNQMVGMFQRFKYDVTAEIKYEGTNYLAVKIYPVDHPGKPGVQMKVFGNSRGHADDIFKDETLKISGGWDCALPVRDRNMGIYQKVFLSFTGDVDIINPYIVTKLSLPDTTEANLKISATLLNASDKKRTGLLKGKIDLLTELNVGDYIKKFPGKLKSVTFEKEIEVPAHDTIIVEMNYKNFPQLTIKNPHLWWPNGYGEQYLHNLELSFACNGEVSVKKNTTFGIREVTNKLKELNGEFGRVFYINGKKIFCRGGWIQPDMLLDMSKKKIYDEARLLAEANINLMSSEDMPSPPEDLMEAFDKFGLMWWEVFYQCWISVPGTISANYPLDHQLAIKNERDIILRYRNYASLVAWCAENENVPGPELYFALKSDLNKLDNTRPFLLSTSILWDWEKFTPYIKSDLPLGITDAGAPGYSWHPSAYYFNIINEVKGQMFRDELGIPSVPTLSSLRKFVFKLGNNKDNELFPLDSVWAEHGVWDGDGYAYRAYDNAIRNDYGFKTKNVADYTRIAQIVNADGYRAMFEAANSRMWNITSGVMLWKLNSSYPEVLWQIYDWFLNPNASYYFTKKACEPLHVQMNANDFKVSVINTFYKSINNLKIRARLYDLNIKVKWEREEKINIEENNYLEIFSIPQLSEITPVYFVRLELIDEKGKLLSSNIYWESSKTPQDFSELSKIENVKPDLSYTVERKQEEYWVHVKLKNPTTKLSFMNRLAVLRKDNDEEILPTFWEDNFITLFPDEEKNIVAKFARKELSDSTFTVVVDNNR